MSIPLLPTGAAGLGMQDTTARLNLDVLAVIMSLVFPGNRAVLFVCKRWSNLLFSLKSLWTVVDHPSKLVFFERSDPALVEVPNVYVGMDKSLWQAVLDHKHRVQRLGLCLESDSLPQLQLYAPGGSLPDQLQHLTVGKHSLKDIPHWTAPAGLRSLRAKHRMNMPSLGLLNPTRLTHLDLYVHLTTPTLADLLERIALCQLLCDLRLLVTGELGQSAPTVSAIDALRVVHLTIFEFDILPFFFVLHPHNLDELHIHLSNDISERSIEGLVDMFDRRIEGFEGGLLVSVSSAGRFPALESVTLRGEDYFSYRLSWYRNRPQSAQMLGYFRDLFDVADSLQTDLDAIPLICNLDLEDGAEALVMPNVAVLWIRLPDGREDVVEAAVSHLNDSALGGKVQFPALEKIEIVPGRKMLPSTQRPRTVRMADQELEEPLRASINATICALVGVEVPVAFKF